MKRLVFLTILFTSIIACQKDYNKTKQAYKFIPNETSAVIQINELNDFVNSIENNEILSGIYNKELKKASQFLKHLNTTKQVYVSFTDTTNSDFLILTENDSTLFVIDSLPNLISETLGELNIEKTQIEDHILYHTIIGNTFAGSNKLERIKNLEVNNENSQLNKLIETTDKKSVASILFKSNAENYSKLLFSKLNDTSDVNFTVLDFDYNQTSLSYNGVFIAKDSSLNQLNSFKNTIPQKINTPSFAPKNTSTLISIAYDDFSMLNKNLNDINQSRQEITPSFLNFTNEIALIDNALILHSLDPNLILESIEDKTNLENFRDIEIFEFSEPDYFNTALAPLLSYNNAQYFAMYETFIVFSNSIDQLKSILTDALNNNTLANTDAFTNINDKLSDEASLFIFKNAEALSNTLGKDMKGYNANAVQFIREDNFTHVNGIIQKYAKKAASNSVVETFNTPVSTTILNTPQAVKNHVTKAHDIVVQDVNNTLYLISSSGNILWKKQLQGKVLGAVEQIDMYKNGRLQLAFATPNRVYVIDRNGNDVSPFPLKFNDEITQPLSVFDYDNKKNYRLLVTQGKHLLMYNSKGQTVKGFNYKNNGSEVLTQPHHFRIGSKDYIVFGAGETLKILNRQGAVRINVKDNISFSENDIYLYQNKFTTTNVLGELIQVDTKGQLDRKNLNLSDKHHITTTSKTLVSLKENKLTIKSRTVDLDYGDYTAPRIFYLNDKIYISTTDLQSKKVYLFDSQAKPIPNFPVFGTAAAELEKLDNDNSLELITQSDDKTILVYKLH